MQIEGNSSEFLAYRILYFIHTANRIELNDVLAELTPTEKETPAVKHALETRAAVASGNYHRLFRLYLDVPNMGGYLMDMFIERERLLALTKITLLYKPNTLPIRFISEELGFESDIESCQFVLNHAGREVLKEETDTVSLICNMAHPIFKEKAQAALRRVDIKGQI